MMRRRIWLITLGAAALLLVFALRWLALPPQATGFIVDRISRSLGLEITAGGASEYRLRGTPMLVLRDVVVREHGQSPLLRARRIYVALPWSTIRAGGEELIAQRIELDAPQLDLPALQRWMAKRPPAETRIPTLTKGVRIRDGVIVNNDWRIDGIDVQLPSLLPEKPLNARIRGRYLDAPTSIPFDLAVALTRPGNDAGLAVIGPLTIQHDDWRMPAHVHLSGPLHIGDDDLRITPARLAMSARYRQGETDLSFVLGLYGPLHFDEATWSLAPAGVALRGRDVMPTLDARGALALGRRLVLQLEGKLAEWPQAWPTLPPPLGQSTTPLPFALRYVGKPDLTEIATLQLQRDDTHFDGRFRLHEVTAWIDAGDGSPLPPLDGRLSTPRLEISGAQLQGVEITIDDPALQDE